MYIYIQYILYIFPFNLLYLLQLIDITYVTRRDVSVRKVHLLEPRKSRKYSRGVRGETIDFLILTFLEAKTYKLPSWMM